MKECPWLIRDYAVGEIMYEFTGTTYGCISPEGVACSEFVGENPFLEFPLNALKEF